MVRGLARLDKVDSLPRQRLVHSRMAQARGTIRSIFCLANARTTYHSVNIVVPTDLQLEPLLDTIRWVSLELPA